MLAPGRAWVVAIVTFAGTNGWRSGRLLGWGGGVAGGTLGGVAVPLAEESVVSGYLPVFTSPEGERATMAAYEAVLGSWTADFEELDVPTQFG